MSIKTADLFDEFEDQVRVALPLLQHFGGTDAFCGQMVCVKVFEDNVLVREALEVNGTDRVLVVDGGGSLNCALFGDKMADLACRNHWNGVIIHGCIRDTKEIAEMPIGLMALAACPKKSSKKRLGIAGEPLRFAGITFIPGHYVYADSDGILVAARNLLPAQ